MEEKAHHKPPSLDPDSYDSTDFDMDDSEPAILKDLWASSESQILSLEPFYKSWDPVVINHHPDRVFSDIRRNSPTWLPLHDFSKRLLLKFARARNLIEDLYKPREKSVLIELFSRTPLTPRLRTLSVVEPLNIPRFDRIDIRDLDTLLPVASTQYPDIYVPSLSISEYIRRFWYRHNDRIYVAFGIAIGVTTLTLLISLWLALYARGEVVQGYESLSSLSMQSKPTEVSESVSDARGHFRRAQVAFIPINIIGAVAPDSTKITNANHAIYAGLASTGLMEEIETLRYKLVTGVNSTGGVILGFLDPRLLTLSNVGITDVISDNPESINRIASLISEAEFHFSEISTTGSLEHDITLEKLRSLLRTSQQMMSWFMSNRDQILQILGHKKPMHYLVLNQNRDELRANGGFPGSAVEVTLYKGRLIKYEKQDIYFYDWHLFPYSSLPPPGIDQVTSSYGIRDANYDPDFRVSFETIANMFEKAGGGTLDGAIAINQWTIQKLLELTGPIQVEWIRELVSASNFSLLLSVLVEGEFARVSSAKDILFKTVESFEKKVLERWDFAAYANLIRTETLNSEILVAFRDSSLEQYWKTLSNSQHAWESTGNFIAPVFTSLSGNKSDRYVERDFMLKSSTLGNCIITNNIQITSRHLMTPADTSSIESLFNQYGIARGNRVKELEVQGNGENRQYLRLLVPKWSKLIRNSPENSEQKIILDTSDPRFDIITTNIRTLVGQKSELFVTYESTPSNCQNELIFQPQPGLQKYQILR